MLYSCFIAENVLQEMDYMTRHQTPISLLDSVLEELPEIHELLLSTEKVKSQTAARVIIYLGKQIHNFNKQGFK